MSEDPRSKLQKKDAERLSVLRKIHDVTGGERNVMVTIDEEQASEFGVEFKALRSAIEWLKDEGLLKGMGTDSVSITHQGRSEVENSIRHPDRETDHFTPLVMQMVNNFHAPVGAFQTGNDAVANVQQNIGS